MMFDLEIVIQKALTSNKTITDYVAKSKQGYPNIGANRTPHGTFPLIEYHQIMGNDDRFCDDKLWTRTYRFQVGIYTERCRMHWIEQCAISDLHAITTIPMRWMIQKSFIAFLVTRLVLISRDINNY